MEKVFSPNVPIPAGHYEQGWKHGGFVFVSGQLPLDPATGKKCSDSVVEQTVRSLKNMQTVLETAGAGLDRVIKVTVYVSDIAIWAEVDKAYGAFFGDHKPARSIVPTGALHYGSDIEIEAIAAV